MQKEIPTKVPYQPRILVIDDETSFTRLLKINLEQTDRYIVRVENDPTLAVSTALSFRPDLVLLDVMMPKLDGGDVAALFSGHERLKEVPVVFLTATVRHKEVDDRHGEFGGQHFISKPVVMSELLQFLDDHFKGVGSSIWMHHA
jgi:CheY-like chemotaxis protein